MPSVTLQAHFDGERIVLDEPFDLPVHASLMVTVLPSLTQANPDSEEAWLRATAASAAFAFLAEPAEDIFTPENGEPWTHAV